MTKQVKLPRHMIKTLVKVEDLVEGQKGYIRLSDAWVDMMDHRMWVEPDAEVLTEPSYRFSIGNEVRIKRVEGGVELELPSDATFIPWDRSYVDNPLPVVRKKKQVKIPRQMISTLVKVEDLVEGQEGYVRLSDAWVDMEGMMWVTRDAIFYNTPSILDDVYVKRVEGGVELTISNEVSFTPTDKSFRRNPLPVVHLKVVEPDK